MKENQRKFFKGTFLGCVCVCVCIDYQKIAKTLRQCDAAADVDSSGSSSSSSGSASCESATHLARHKKRQGEFQCSAPLAKTNDQRKTPKTLAHTHTHALIHTHTERLAAAAVWGHVLTAMATAAPQCLLEVEMPVAAFDCN